MPKTIIKNSIEEYRVKQLMKDLNLILPNDQLEITEFKEILKQYIDIDGDEN